MDSWMLWPCISTETGREGRAGMNKCAELSGERRVVSVRSCVCVGVYVYAHTHIHTAALSTFDDMECEAK